MDGYDNDMELDAENDESAREIERRRVYECNEYIWLVARAAAGRPIGPHQQGCLAPTGGLSRAVLFLRKAGGACEGARLVPDRRQGRSGSIVHAPQWK